MKRLVLVLLSCFVVLIAIAVFRPNRMDERSGKDIRQRMPDNGTDIHQNTPEKPDADRSEAPPPQQRTASEGPMGHGSHGSTTTPSDHGKVVSQEHAVRIARAFVDTPKSGVSVPAHAHTEVTYSNGKYTITFLEPPSPRPIPRAGYYAIVTVDEKTGTVSVLGPP